MRTTVVIDETLTKRLKGLAEQRVLSDFINQCLHEHFFRQERAKRLAELELSYARAAKGSGNVSKDFRAVDVEDWPEW